MNQESHIADDALPYELDFNALKSSGLAYIQAHSSTQWTNFNPADPGVTILEQLCYAFTELGYCIDFPIEDILTKAEGKLQIQNQFYTPETILTTTPITINDYKKLVYDQISTINAISISGIPINVPSLVEIYETYISFGANTKPKEKTNSYLSTYFFLNANRNLGAYFEVPKPLKNKSYSISGVLELEDGYEANTVINAITNAVNNYVFTKPNTAGYEEFKKEGKTTNEIFNGPKLKNGWIDSNTITAKKDSIHNFEIVDVIANVEGVSSITNLYFIDSNRTDNLSIATSNNYELIVFDFKSSIKNAQTRLHIFSQGEHINTAIDLTFTSEFSPAKQFVTQIGKVSSVVMTPQLPEGSYRDIETYYSIQNTFPEIYAVGKNATNKNTPPYKTAISRQLKGYLTLFDQLFTNQFAQLANIDKLFSFKNSLTGNFTDSKNDKTHKKTKEDRLYPAPFKSFSPTYFYQSLYKSVPDLKPLLKDNFIFDFGPVTQTQDEEAKESWLSFKKDPYNAYMHGLMLIMENEGENLDRRNAILDHLLARHGESPLLINAIIFDDLYSGNYDKDKVIVKSIYLENLQILSYNRTRGYNFFGATALPQLNTISKTSPAANSKDFIIDTNAISETQNITAFNITNCATITLKAYILLALQQHYDNYLNQEHTDKGDYNHLARWMLSNTKGLLCIELNLLYLSAKFNIHAVEEDTEGIMNYYSNTLNYSDFCKCIHQLESNPKTTLKNHFQRSDSELQDEEASISIANHPNYKWNASVSWGDNFKTVITNKAFDTNLVFILPKFIKSLNTPNFEHRFKLLLDNELPVNISYQIFYLDTNLKMVLGEYISWHNSLIFNTNTFNTNLENNPILNKDTDLDIWYDKFNNHFITSTFYNTALVNNTATLSKSISKLFNPKTDA